MGAGTSCSPSGHFSSSTHDAVCSNPECIFLSDHTGSRGLAGGYIPSFLKKEVGSSGQRVQLAPIINPFPTDPSARKYILIILYKS